MCRVSVLTFTVAACTTFQNTAHLPYHSKDATPQDRPTHSWNLSLCPSFAYALVFGARISVDSSRKRGFCSARSLASDLKSPSISGFAGICLGSCAYLGCIRPSQRYLVKALHFVIWWCWLSENAADIRQNFFCQLWIESGHSTVKRVVRYSRDGIGALEPAIPSPTSLCDWTFLAKRDCIAWGIVLNGIVIVVRASLHAVRKGKNPRA